MTSSGLVGGRGLHCGLTGQLLANFACSFGHITIMVAEILALIEGVKLCINHGCMELLIELDSQALCHRVLGETAPWAIGCSYMQSLSSSSPSSFYFGAYLLRS
ncbi:hypothetical protein ACH5RR_003339 [Cinchona calisaya]|uniref:RNase H type-1 domain-containing protein n=1 Tax=Cinchona calisaya TaxID=153742 RepID=A0ABD3AUJ8_9GENT